MKKLFTFVAVKLSLLVIIATCSAIFAKLIAIISDGSKSAVLAQTTASAIFFFAFVYYIGTQIKAPPEAQDGTADASYYLVFTLKEASIYAVFLLPVTVYLYLAPDVTSTFDKILYYFCLPHSFFEKLGVGAAVNFAAMIILFAIVSYTSHKAGVRRARKLALSSAEEPKIEVSDINKARYDDISDNDDADNADADTTKTEE
ncbi:MAG: hypothetical protein WBI55_04770 [Eubacteriales bacterium]|nr:hypothetical protein [Clostridiales bacterium]